MSEVIKFSSASSLISGDLSKSVVPAGYVRISLSTKGKISEAPDICFARAMTASEILSLSLYIKEEVQGPLIGILDSIIYKSEENPVASVAKWTMEEVIEFIIKYYSNFFGVKLSEIDYTPIQSEFDKLAEQKRDVEIDSIKKGMWKPKIDLDLSKIEYLSLPEKASKRLIVTDEKNKDFSVAFRFPYYGDILIINQIMNAYKESNKDNANKEGTIDETVLYTLLSNAILIDKINDTDISNLSVKDKLEMIKNDSKFSLSMFDKVNEEFDKIKFGINEDIIIKSPLTGETITRRFHFRVMDVISAIILYESNDYVVRFE